MLPERPRFLGAVLASSVPVLVACAAFGLSPQVSSKFCPGVCRVPPSYAASTLLKTYGDGELAT